MASVVTAVLLCSGTAAAADLDIGGLEPLFLADRQSGAPHVQGGGGSKQALAADILQALAAEIETLDGGWLLNRDVRTQQWSAVVSDLTTQIQTARKASEIALAFRRLDAAYTNQHAFVKFGPLLSRLLPDGRYPWIEFAPDWSALDSVTFRISAISGNNPGIEIGDELTHINGRSVSEWQEAHFNLCKKPSLGHCASDFFDDFFTGLLPDYQPGDRLSYTVDRSGTAVTVDVPLGATPGGYTSGPEACGKETGRYPGWTLAYEGDRACVYTDTAKPGVALLRIPSFGYDGSHPVIDGVEDEVAALFTHWWQANGGSVEHLVIDVLDNGGGNPSYPYVGLMATQDYQSPYAALKKAGMYADPAIRQDLLEERGQVAALVENGSWDGIPDGTFLDSLPMFCADDSDCANSMNRPLAHNFTGDITVLVNPRCVSSCDDLVNLLDDLMGARVRFVGLPNAADSALMRYQLVVYLDTSNPDGFRIAYEVDDSIEAPDGALLAQIISVTRPTLYQSDTPRTAVPVTLDAFVPYGLDEEEGFHLKALDAALDL